jgi:hypothetical protein
MIKKPAHIPQSVWDDTSTYCEERDGKVMRDGQTMRVPHTAMDSRPRSHFIADAAPPKPELAHRPTSFAMSATDAADLAKMRAEAEAKLNDAWRSPPPVAATTDTTTTPSRPSAPAFDASMSLDALREAATQRLVNAWRHP